MAVTAVVGAQWGDEGKGRVVDYLAQDARWVVRYQGGDNAGHTVVNEHGTFRLHIVPSGIFNPETRCLVGAGTVVNPDTLLEEIDALQKAGVSTENLYVDRRAHIIFPYHRILDDLRESARGEGAIGTTKRGIGPAYAHKAARIGIRMGDLLNEEWLKGRLEQALTSVNRELSTYGHAQIPLGEIMEKVHFWRKQMGHRVVDSVPMLKAAIGKDEPVLLEGQLGVMRDLDWGEYPFVTSSNPVGGYGPVGVGFPSWRLSEIWGVAKAYTTAVGAGPFPAELTDESGDILRARGNEYGATTGRPRRTGWFDAVAIKYAAWTGGLTDIVITKLDVLDAFPEIKVAVAYRLPDGSVTREMPDTWMLEHVEPVWESHPGWETDTSNARHWEDLPLNAREYIRRLEDLSGVPIVYVSVGPERGQIVPARER